MFSDVQIRQRPEVFRQRGAGSAYQAVPSECLKRAPGLSGILPQAPFYATLSVNQSVCSPRLTHDSQRVETCPSVMKVLFRVKLTPCFPVCSGSPALSWEGA